MKDMKFNYALIFAILLQAIGLVWYVSKIDSKVNILYDKYETESDMEVVENQVKMKLDLENLMADVKAIKKELKKSKNKDKEIMEQHNEIFNLLRSGNNVPNNYSYGD
jgi:seryl-tRNA synthetase